jgi:hypothetical protein
MGIALSLETGYLSTGGTRTYVAAQRVGRQTVALGRRLGDAGIEGHGLAAAALSAYLSGFWRESLERARAAEKALRDHGRSARWLLNLTEYFMGTMNWCLGDVNEMVRLVAVYLRDAEERGDLYAQRALRGWRTNVAWLAVDRPDEARAQVESVAAPPLLRGETAQLAHYYELISQAQIDLYQGHGEAALARVEAMWPALHAAMLLRIQSIQIEAYFLRARAALAVAQGAAPDARVRLVRLARGCAKSMDGAGAAWGRALATLVRAGAARVVDDADGEVALLRAACVGLDATEMTLFAAAARHRLGRRLAGDEGATLAREAEARMKTQGVVNRAPLGRMLLGLESD